MPPPPKVEEPKIIEKNKFFGAVSGSLMSIPTGDSNLNSAQITLSPEMDTDDTIGKQSGIASSVTAKPNEIGGNQQETTENKAVAVPDEEEQTFSVVIPIKMEREKAIENANRIESVVNTVNGQSNIATNVPNGNEQQIAMKMLITPISGLRQRSTSNRVSSGRNNAGSFERPLSTR